MAPAEFPHMTIEFQQRCLSMPKMALYSEAFRREVVRLLRTGGRCHCSRVNWGARRSRLRNWSRQLDVDEGKAEGLARDKRGERPPRWSWGDVRRAGGEVAAHRPDGVPSAQR